jgi:hypothetical protein
MSASTNAASQQGGTGASSPVGWQFRIGATIFVAGFAAPLAIPLVTSSSLPVAWKTGISGALAIGIPEIAMVAAAAIMGKEGFAQLKLRFGRLLRRYGPPDIVGPIRYRIGLVMFTVPMLLGWLEPYLHHYLSGFDTQPVWVHVGGDVSFIASFFILGGDFWDKLRALFVQGATAVFPNRET